VEMAATRRGYPSQWINPGAFRRFLVNTGEKRAYGEKVWERNNPLAGNSSCTWFMCWQRELTTCPKSAGLHSSTFLPLVVSPLRMLYLEAFSWRVLFRLPSRDVPDTGQFEISEGQLVRACLRDHPRFDCHSTPALFVDEPARAMVLYSPTQAGAYQQPL
jgi:hypothetical protein